MTDPFVIVADENIAAADDALARYGEVRLLSGRRIDREALADVDALVVRSITRVDRELLEGTPVRFVGTATIGRDHLDEEYLWQRGITPVDAAGGAARSVAEYTATSAMLLQSRGLVELRNDRCGVIGVGAIGRKSVEFLRALGADVVEYDPPRADAEEEFQSASLEEIVACKLLVLAVPLTHGGDHPTEQMIDTRFMDRLPSGASIINVARGGVLDTEAFASRLAAGRLRGVVDVWEGEPEVDPDLLAHCELVTPHIAGYSRDGKLRGTEMMARGLAEFLGREDHWSSTTMLGSAGRIVLDTTLSPDEQLLEAMLTACPITRDDRALRELFGLDPEQRRKGFDRLRREYPVRREFPAWEVAQGDGRLEMLGFQTRDDS